MERAFSPPPPRPAHGEGALERPWRDDRCGGDGRAVHLDRGFLAAFGRAGGGAGEARRCRCLRLPRPRPPPGFVAVARPWRAAPAPLFPRPCARPGGRRETGAPERGARGPPGLLPRPTPAAPPPRRLS